MIRDQYLWCIFWSVDRLPKNVWAKKELTDIRAEENFKEGSDEIIYTLHVA